MACEATDRWHCHATDCGRMASQDGIEINKKEREREVEEDDLNMMNDMQMRQVLRHNHRRQRTRYRVEELIVEEVVVIEGNILICI